MLRAPTTVLLTGATGFIGRHVAVSLLAMGARVRATSREPKTAKHWMPNIDWVQCDMTQQASIREAMAGTNAAIYLYHGLGTGSDYEDREAHAARTFRLAAEDLKLERLVYLGGVEPLGTPSRHLRSRLETGRILREGQITTVELRAAMVIGHDSQSFSLVRDVALKLPLLALPNWLDRRSCPIAITDVAAALALALVIPLAHSAWFDLPGPQCLSHRELVEVLTRSVGVPIVAPRIRVTPSLVAVALAVLSSVKGTVSRELVQGLSYDLLPRGDSFWTQLGVPQLRSVKEAVADAFADEVSHQSPSRETRGRIETVTREWLTRLERPHG